MEKYSVLMSLYHKDLPEYLKLALDSMIKQTFPPDEIVLIEDGPLTKELYDVVAEYNDLYPDILRVVINETNLGLGKSLNKGLLLCQNELVARMDADDISVLDRCEKQVLYFQKNPDISILGGQIEEFIDTIDNVVGKRTTPENDKLIKEFMKKRCPLNHVAVMFKRSDVLNAGNYLDWFWNEDYYLWVRMAIQQMKFANLPDTLVYVRVGRDMYKRRGGIHYFKSEARLQKYMFDNRVIGRSTYVMNIIKRLIVQILLPNGIRGWVFKTFARD